MLRRGNRTSKDFASSIIFAEEPLSVSWTLFSIQQIAIPYFSKTKQL
jgi:hypothetical protein